MDREGFRNRMKQCKKAREENPGLKYWEWKDIPKYDEGTEGVRDNTYVAPIEKELVFIPAIGTTKLKQDIINKLTRNGQIKSGALDIVSPEFDLALSLVGTPMWLREKNMSNLARQLVSKTNNKVLTHPSVKSTVYYRPDKLIDDDTYIVTNDLAKELSAMYRRNKSKETESVLHLLGKNNTGSTLKRNLNAQERAFFRKHNVDESVLTGADIKRLKELRLQSISKELEKNLRVVTTPFKSEDGTLILQKNTENGLSAIGQVNYDIDPYNYMKHFGRELKPIDNVDLTNDLVISWIQGSLGEKGVSKDLYNGLAHWLNQTSPGSGFVSGLKLMSPEATTKVLNKLNKTLISNLGEYHWATGATLNNPVYRITKPTGEYPAVKSLLFDPKIIKNGKIITDINNPNIYFAEGGEVGEDDFMKQFGKQVSYKPEETSWWSNVKNWWNDLTGMKNYAYGNCATTPGGKHTKECAHYSNSILRNQGYKNIVGDAWTRAANSGMKKITSGYDGLTKPIEWNENDAHEYLQSAAENFASKIDTTGLKPYDVIGLYYPDSPNTKKAFEQGRWGETQTHTGHTVIGKDGTHYVVHNVNGHLKINKLADMLTGDYEYKPVSAYRPKKYADGGEVEPDPLDVLERSRPKFHGIPLAKGNIDGVFSPIDVPLATLPKVWPVVNKWLPNYGQMLGALVGGDEGLTVNKRVKPLTTKQIDADVKEHYEDVVIPLRPLEDYIKQIYLQNPNNFIYNVYADNALPDNRLADFNNATGEVRIKESVLNSPISSQILAHEINGHRSDRLLPRSKEAKATIDKAFNVRKKPLSEESKLLAEKEAETTRLSYNFYKHMKDNGLLLVKKPMTKTKAYQDYVLNATDEQIDAMLGNSTVYSRDYKASGIDYDKIRWALAYAPEIAAGLIIPQHLLNDDKDVKQWT